MKENPYQSPKNAEPPRRRMWLWIVLAGVGALGILVMMMALGLLLWVSPSKVAPIAVLVKSHQTSP